MSIKFNTNIPGWSCGIINKLGPFTLHRQQPNWWLIWVYHTHSLRTLSQHNPCTGISEILTLRISDHQQVTKVALIHCLFFSCQNLEFFISHKQFFTYFRYSKPSTHLTTCITNQEKCILVAFSYSYHDNLLLMTEREYGTKCFL